MTNLYELEQETVLVEDVPGEVEAWITFLENDFLRLRGRARYKLEDI